MVIPALDRDLAAAAQRDAEREHAFWHEHVQELLRRYPDQLVAVQNGEVVAASGDLLDLVSQLEAKGLSPPEV